MKPEITYERDLQGAWMLLPAGPNGMKTYQMTMILKNHIPGCVLIREQREPDSFIYRYDISSLISLPEYLAHHPLTEPMIKQWVFRLYQVVNELGNYLLQEEYLLLMPETIFIMCQEETQEAWDFRFCVDPQGGQDLRQALKELVKYLMAQTDETQEGSGPLCYELYGRLQKDNFCLREWMEVLEHWSVPTPAIQPEPKKGAKQLFASSRKGGIIKKTVW